MDNQTGKPRKLVPVTIEPPRRRYLFYFLGFLVAAVIEAMNVSIAPTSQIKTTGELLLMLFLLQAGYWLWRAWKEK